MTFLETVFFYFHLEHSLCHATVIPLCECQSNTLSLFWNKCYTFAPNANFQSTCDDWEKETRWAVMKRWSRRSICSQNVASVRHHLSTIFHNRWHNFKTERATIMILSPTGSLKNALLLVQAKSSSSYHWLNYALTCRGSIWPFIVHAYVISSPMQNAIPIIDRFLQTAAQLTLCTLAKSQLWQFPRSTTSK